MARPHGQIRQSQMITTYGPGALVDLPHRAAIVAGLETWSWGGDDRHQPRLLDFVAAIIPTPAPGFQTSNDCRAVR